MESHSPCIQKRGSKLPRWNFSVSFKILGLILSFFIFQPLQAQVVINEVITDPQQDWSTNGFDGTIGVGSIDSDDDWIELYISSNGLNLTGWTIELNDGTNESGTIAAGGAFVVSNYISTTGGTFTNTDAGDYLILGTMTSGAINQSVTVILRDNTTAIIDQVEIASGSGTMFTGSASNTDDESVCRIPNGGDTGVDADDFVKTRATLGTSNSPSGTVLINEVVTTPRQDWSAGAFADPSPGGTGGTNDEWIELYIATSGLNLTRWILEITDSNGTFNGDLTSSGAFDVSNYVGTGSFTNTVAGDFLILGNPDGSNDINTNAYITLTDPSGTQVDDVEIGDDFEGDGNGDGAPTSAGATVDDESIGRIAVATDTDVDADDFIRVVSTLGSENGRSTVFVDGSATDDTGVGTVGDPKQLIQSGIDLVLAGGTVTVVADSYAENITINKSLTLNGANQGVAGNGSRGGESIIDVAGAAITINADNVTIDGFQFGTDPTTSSINNGIVSSGNNNITITNNVVHANSVGIAVAGSTTGTTDITNNLVSMVALEDAGNPGIGSIGVSLTATAGDVDANVTSNNFSTCGIGIATYSLQSSTEAVIDGGSFTGCQTGILPVNFDGGGGFAPSTLTIQNLTMSGFALNTDLTNPDTQAGVYVVAGGTAGGATEDITVTLTNLDISGVGNGESNFSGIIIGDFPDAADGVTIDATITNCNVHDNSNRGIYLRGEATGAISQCSITGNGFDPHATAGNPGFSVIAILGASATVSNSVITNPASLSGTEDIPTSYYTSGLHLSDGGSLTVTDCNISQNGNGFIAETSGIDLSGNHFGTISEATILSLVGANNDFSPWLGTDTDTDLVTDGFQGDFSDLHIGTSGSQTTSFFQEAHDLLSADGSLTVNAGSYTETLTATQNMTISPASGTSIDNLTLDGGNVTVTSALTVSNTLTLTNGILDIDLDDGNKSDDPVLVLSSPVAGSFGASNHIEGKVRTEVSAATPFLFPVGDLGTYRPVTVNPASTATFTASHIFANTPTGGGALPSINDLVDETSATPSGLIQSVMDYKYWTVDVTGSPGLTDLTLQLTTDDNATDPSTLGIARFDGSTWSVINQTGNVDTNPVFTVTTQTSTFSDFSIYSTNSMDNLLPVELIGFKGTIRGGQAELTWTTASENNSDFFEIERKLGEQDEFESVGRVSASGHSNSQIDYQFSDRVSASDPLFYRLKMVDFDGSFEYSVTLILIPDFDDQSLIVYPNPSSEFIQFQGVEFQFVKEVRFYDFSGRLRKSILSPDQSRWSVSDLASGHYIMHIELLDGNLFKGEIVVED